MALNKYKLGELIERADRRNTDLEYGVEDVRGVLNTKGFMTTHANIEGRALDRFQIVLPNEFAFNRRTTRNGERLGLGFNNTDRNIIVTEDYVVFKIKENAKDTLLAVYLYVFFLRDEFDRYVRYSSWGSATEFFNWDDMCDVPIVLPSLLIQQKYVDIYNAMVQNQKAYEISFDDLKLTCDAYIEKLRREFPHTAIGPIIEQSDERNGDLKFGLDSLKGISINKCFIETKADMEGISLASYKIIYPEYFGYVSVTSRNGGKLSFAHNNSDSTYLVSSTYIVFKIKDKKTLLPEYLNITLNRSEFDRFARFHSWGSAREVFSFEDICEVEIPIPKIEIQQDIANIFRTYTIRKNISEKLKTQIKAMCPILIKGALEDGEKK
ncbi:hypothetical protein TREPR_2282 [Treponema primitia ZAS-2]|uniref:Type I restriction modification DNA specificity domain-containing protein n=1 Tax=Treponema primitia (strain ATCC BAA-887 / DSM 12427 / ZAS-2) TaxID=545694 RepID=F5YI21_TREPZ|nr:restriction endonuclease subunit S [Treponema primitia]AEF84308.1 hypothetical protein TREPR_2282 [Treponema primitia ZAS-2]